MGYKGTSDGVQRNYAVMRYKGTSDGVQSEEKSNFIHAFYLWKKKFERQKILL